MLVADTRTEGVRLIDEVQMDMEPVKHRDGSDGFSVVEVVVAAAILFFVLTAVLGLVATSQKMSVSAKQRAVLTNATAYYVDRVRSMPFDTVGIQGQDASGTILANDTITFNGYSVAFANTVTNYIDSRGDTYLKEIIIRATCTVGGKQYSTSAVAAIKNPRNDRTSATLADPNSPSIQFDDAVTPAPNEVLYSTQRNQGGSIRIQTIATSPHDKIVEVAYRSGGGNLLYDPTLQQYAKFTFTPGYVTTTNHSGWDTDQDTVGEGFQTVTVAAKDDSDRVVTLDRKFIIDNDPPQSPGAPDVTVSTATSSTAAWAAGVDGNQAYATRYGWELYREAYGAVAPPASGNWSYESSGTIDAGVTIPAAASNAGPIGMTLVHQPFSRYWLRIRSGSPRLWNNSFGSLATPFISRPDVLITSPHVSTGTTTASRGKTTKVDYTATIWLPKPTFPYDATALADKANYVVDRYDPATGMWTGESSAYFTVDTSGTGVIKVVITHTEPSTYTPARYYFRVGIGVKPTGWQGGSITPKIYSPAAGPMPQPAIPVKPPGAGGTNTTTLTGPLGMDWSL